MPTVRDHYPPPWSIEATPSGFKVVDSNGHVLAYTYAKDDRRVASYGRMTTAEARTMAEMIARLPELVAVTKEE